MLSAIFSICFEHGLILEQQLLKSPSTLDLVYCDSNSFFISLFSINAVFSYSNVTILDSDFTRIDLGVIIYGSILEWLIGLTSGVVLIWIALFASVDMVTPAFKSMLLFDF